MVWGTKAVDFEERVNYRRLREDRLKKAEEQIAAHDLGALLCFDFDNIRYITSTHIGEWGRDKMERFVILPEGAEPILYDLAAAAKRENCPWIADRLYPSIEGFRVLPQEVGRMREFAEEVKGTLEDHGVENEPLGIDITNAPVMKSLEKEGVEVVDGHQTMLDARMIKTKDEISLLETSAAMADAAYEDVVRNIRPGIRENELVAKINETLYTLGSDLVECVNCISGPRGSPHPHNFSDRIIRPRELVYLDIMHSFNGYRTCYYRTFSCGNPTGEQVEAYRKAWDWLKNSIDAVEPGATTADVARSWPPAEEFGFDNEKEAFGLQFGHGVGMSHREKPIISRALSLDHPSEIKEGMVFALETYCPVKGGEGAARIEEEVVVTAKGAEPIFRYPPEELISAGMSGERHP